MIARISLGAALFATAFTAHAANGTRQELQGCWRGERTVLHYQDGSTSETRTSCVTRYGERDYLTICPDPSGSGAEARMEGRYERISDSTYVATLVSHSRLPGLAGQRSTVSFRLNGDRLDTMVYPPRTSAGLKQIAAVETSSSRMPDERPSMRCPAL